MPEQLHPRTLQAQRYWDRMSQRARAVQEANLVGSYYPGRMDIGWIDYLEGIDGTVPEKLLLQEIIGRGVSVWFSVFFGDFPFTTDREERVRPDFVLPDYRIIVEVAGEYWHSREGSWERDAQRAAWYTVMGFDVRIIPDYEILENPLDALLRHVPELENPQFKGNEFLHPEHFQPAAPIISLRKKWPKVQRTRYRGQRKFPSTRPTGGPPPKIKRIPGPMFPGFGPLDAEYVKKLKDYGAAYRKWIRNDLGQWVQSVLAAEGQYFDRVWVGDPDHEGETDYYDTNPIGRNGKPGKGPFRVPWGGDVDYYLHKGYGHWQYLRFVITDEMKKQIQFYYKWRNWWNRFGL